MSRYIRFEKGKIVRRYSPKWRESQNSTPYGYENAIKGLLSQRESMLDYIDALHDKIDVLTKRIKARREGNLKSKKK